MENNRGLLCFCLGCAAGAVAAVLFTPKSGRETTEYLSQKTNEGTDYVKRRVDDVRDAVTGAIERGERAVRSEAENLRAAVDAGKQAYKNAQETNP
ncbi:MAG: YtxH domain-containing protein [Bryobacteraceae bacterium]